MTTTTLLNIKDLLKKTDNGGYFTLTTEKLSTWEKWLNNELDYINGEVYLNTTKPVIRTQTLKQLLFDNASKTTTECKIMINGDSFIASQSNNVYIANSSLGVTDLTSTILTNPNGLRVEIKNNYNGTYIIRIPSYVGSANIYTGCTIKFLCKKQTLTLSDWSKNGNSVSFHLTATNPVKNQSVVINKLDRNGNIMGSESSSLTDGSVDFSFSMGSSVVSLRIMLKPVKSSSYYYLGNELSYTNNGEEIV